MLSLPAFTLNRSHSAKPTAEDELLLYTAGAANPKLPSNGLLKPLRIYACWCTSPQRRVRQSVSTRRANDPKHRRCQQNSQCHGWREKLMHPGASTLHLKAYCKARRFSCEFCLRAYWHTWRLQQKHPYSPSAPQQSHELKHT